MMTAEENERLSRVGPGTPCGRLMRCYWHPIAASAQLARPGTRPVRILGENLVLYRDKQGGLGLVEPQCAHRRAGLVFGIPDEQGLRCAYHGWLYNAKGQCIDQPFEAYLHPKTVWKHEIQIKAYPVQELGGLIFAYLGPEPVPLLPRWEALVLEDAHREIGFAMIPCNWLQTVENAGDPSHVVATHWQLSEHVLDKLGRSDLQRHSESSGAKGYSQLQPDPEGPYGLGHILFPYTDAQNDLTYQIRVPVDDTHTLHIWYMAHTREAQAELGIELPSQAHPCEIPVFDVPVPRLVNGIEPDWPLLDNNSGQDLVMWYSQGEILDRSQENLANGDMNIVRMRRFLDKQIKIVEDGSEPINVFRDPVRNVCLIPTRTAPMPPRMTPDGRPDRTNAARKYSPAYMKATITRQNADTPLDPAY
jgi:5,5'-dehydrodivanillate O-demethylase